MKNREILFIGVVVFVASFLRHYASLDADADKGHESTITVRFQYRFQMAWDESGFWALGGRPIFPPTPTVPVSGPTYLNHPPLAHWIYRIPVFLFGRSIITLRSTAAVMTSIFCALLVLFCARRRGRIGAAAAFIACITSPMLLFFGQMANFESPALLLGAALLLLGTGSERWSRSLGLLLCYLLVLVDWVGLFFLPAIWLMNPERRLARSLGSGLAMLAGLATCALLMWSWEGSQLGFTLQNALLSARGEGYEMPRDALTRPLKGLLRCYGPLPLLALVVFTGVHLRRLKQGRAGRFERFSLGYSIVGLLNVAAFPSRAYDHEFWWIYFVPAITCCLVETYQFAQTRFGTPGSAVLTTILLLQLPISMNHQKAWTINGLARPTAELMNSRFDESTLIVMPEKRCNWLVYADAWVVDGVRSLEEIGRLVDLFLAGEVPQEELAFCYSGDPPPEFAPAVQKAIHQGASFETEGDFSFVVFKRPD